MTDVKLTGLLRTVCGINNTHFIYNDATSAHRRRLKISRLDEISEEKLKAFNLALIPLNWVIIEHGTWIEGSTGSTSYYIRIEKILLQKLKENV